MSADKNANILIAEDNERIRSLLASLLKNVGFTRVTEAANGQEAWAKLQSAEFDLLLTDWVMPEMNGLELLQAIRSSKKPFARMPVLMITASDDQNNVIEAAKYAVNGYILKPFSVKVVVKKIEECLAG